MGCENCLWFKKAKVNALSNRGVVYECEREGCEFSVMHDPINFNMILANTAHYQGVQACDKYFQQVEDVGYDFYHEHNKGKREELRQKLEEARKRLADFLAGSIE